MDLNFRGWLPIRENRESLVPQKFRSIWYIDVEWPRMLVDIYRCGVA